MYNDNIVNFRPGFSLWLRFPIISNGAYRLELSKYAEDFDMRIADDGSDYMTFRVSASEELPINRLVDWFSTMIGGDIALQTDTSDTVFRGMLKAMVLSAGGDAEIIDLDQMANEAIVEHSGGTSGVITDPIASPESINYFGSKLIHITDTNDLTLADATRVAQNYLKMNAWARPVSYSGDSRDSLEFQFVGYLYMLDWQEDSIVAPLTVKAAIEQVITNTGQGVVTFTPNSIQDNGQTWNSNISGTGLELIRKLTNMLDSSGNVWRFYIDNDNVAHYEPVVFTPYYYRRVGVTPNSTGVYISGNTARTFTGKAGVIIRNLGYPISTPEIGSPFQSRQDRYVEAIRFNKDGQIVIESLRKYNESWSQAEQYKVNPNQGDF